MMTAGSEMIMTVVAVTVASVCERRTTYVYAKLRQYSAAYEWMARHAEAEADGIGIDAVLKHVSPLGKARCTRG